MERLRTNERTWSSVDIVVSPGEVVNTRPSAQPSRTDGLFENCIGDTGSRAICPETQSVLPQRLEALWSTVALVS